ncbi:MAG TPA: beta-ketoacyl-ACP synthase II [Bacteroidales bacterium]|mgnify:FL=1|jgi:3-oxoacyl-[acyl-carrier-protein] synthase II|nr:beta-ketoacyl-ACP synthase II [Bacteroidales bacterium]MBP7036965.1 beta-ketoacyl-ACP synthase II [Bacteroidales bacterium]MBP8710199.1 beta-ketoacyl-ACP synthase II [Bacteroidales bacterium]MZQ80272.1 beta-ketoacyl-ACP synthase II [Bacteroidales bacterium]HNY58420.1 beta-ketoacyl-ACP synthase II [Bacteroidales bacterium]
MRRVVVTGMGALTPIGNNLQDFWKNLVDGVSGAELITRFDPSRFKTRFACEIKEYDPSRYLDRKESRKMDRYTQYAHIAADEAVKDAALDPGAIDKDRCGIIWGSGIGGIETFLDEVKGFVTGDGTPRFSPFFIPRMISNIAAGMLSIKYGFRGPNFGTVSACSSSTNALIDAYYYIKLGKADLFIAGGSEASINPAGIGGFNAMQAMSTNNDEYATASRPFDVTRDGFVIGEGAGTLILEELGHARARGARIYAELAGSGLTADAYHITAPHPDGIGAVNVMKQAIDEAGLKPSDVDYINVHGTATPLGDIAEIKAINALFGEHAYKLNISATKSMTGHLLGAAGAVEAIATIMAIVHGIVPPTINFRNPDPAIDQNLNLTLNKAQRRTVNVALSNNFGFGGHNASILIRKFNE